MSSPSEYEAPTVVIRDFYAVMFEGWSPSELHGLDPHLTMLRTGHEPITVPGKCRLLLRSSMCATPFDVIHAFWDPHAPPPVADRAKALDAPCTQVIVHTMGVGERPHAHGAPLAARGSLYNGKTSHLDPFQQVFVGLSDNSLVVLNSGSTSKAPSSTDEAWFRIVSDCGTGRRRFVVERSTSHVLVLLQALRFSFPYLAVPFISEVTSSTITVVLEFASRHCDALQTYVPLMYFMFEQNFKAFHAATAGLGDLIRQYQQMEERVFQQAKRPQKSGWFGFGSSSSSTASPSATTNNTTAGVHGSSGDEGYETGGMGGLMSLKEEVDYAERDERIGKHLPPQFRARYFESTRRHACMSDALQNTYHLQHCLAEEGEALERLAEAFTELQATLSDDFIASIPEEEEVEKENGNVQPIVRSPTRSAETSDGAASSSPKIEVPTRVAPPPTVRDVNKILKGFATVCAVLQNQVAIPMATGLCGAVGEVEVYAMTRRQFLRSMIHYAKFVQDKEALVLGKEDIRDTPASANPAIMAKIKDVYAKRRSTLRSQKQHMDDEIARLDRLSKVALGRVCTIVASLFHHLTDAYDSRHYQGLEKSATTTSSERSPPSSQHGSSSPLSPMGSSSVVPRAHPIECLLSSVPCSFQHPARPPIPMQKEE